MSQAEINSFVESACVGTLTPEGVTSAVITKGIPVNGQHVNDFGNTALHYAVLCKHSQVVVALLAAGADASKKNLVGETSIWEGAAYSTAHILQLLIDGGGSVNEPDNFGQTPLIALVRYNFGNVAARLQVLLACIELDLHATYDGKTAEEWAVHMGYSDLAVAIAEGARWVGLRAAWIGVAVTITLEASYI
jgi:ankyrin repeat protein